VFFVINSITALTYYDEFVLLQLNLSTLIRVLIFRMVWSNIDQVHTIHVCSDVRYLLPDTDDVSD